MTANRTAGDRHHQSRPIRILKNAWPTVKRLLPWIFFALVAWLLINQAQSIDWAEVRQALTGYSLTAVMLGCLFAAGSYLAYASYDLFGRYYVRHGISRPRTMLIAFICCAFTLNLGALVGSVGFRYRLYTQRGLSKGAVAHIFGMSVTTNWMGYIFLAGLVFITGSVTVPFGWEISNFTLRLLGGLFLVIVMAYFMMSLLAKKRTWSIRGQPITLPRLRIAVMQLLASSMHWLLMCGVIFTFLYTTDISFFSLLGVLLISSIAGLLTHIPGALGVLEAVFIALLGDQIPPATLVAALIAYRAAFYLMPLAVATVVYLMMEVSARKAA